MSMIAKAEKNLAANRPGSKAALSIQSIIKDLQDLDKSLVTKNELEAMKTKMKKLEKENSRMKIELQATEADRKLYYNQFHENVKELNDLKAENESLKEEISSLKKTEESNIEEIANSSFQSAIPVNDTPSDIDNDEGNQAMRTTLPIENDDNGIACSGPSVLEQIVSPGSKRPRLIQLWKCSIMPCKDNRFTLAEDLRSHIVDCHPERRYLCSRCPFSTNHRANMNDHERSHVTNELKYSGVEGAKKCTLCDVYFQNNLNQHNKMYH